jgi:DNA ligase (NAD+)
MHKSRIKFQYDLWLSIIDSSRLLSPFSPSPFQKSDSNTATYVVDLKYDGVAVNLQFENGSLTHALSRGDGAVGDEMLPNLVAACDPASLPRTVPQELYLRDRNTGQTTCVQRFEVRCEVVIPRSTFTRINDERVEQSLFTFKNTRNLVAGLMKLKLTTSPRSKRRTTVKADADVELADNNNSSNVTGKSSLYLLHSHEQRLVQLIAHTLVIVDQQPLSAEQLHEVVGAKVFDFPQTHAQSIELLKALGFQVCSQFQTCRDINDAAAFIERRLEQERTRPLDYDCDGVVVKVNSLRLQQELGTQARFPRWAVAYKYPSHTMPTVIKDIHIQVGRSGKLTPVALLQPIQLGGSTISRATLHNFNFIARKQLRVGATVLVQKAGEVIPRVIGLSQPEASTTNSSAVPLSTALEVADSLLAKSGTSYLCPCHLKSSLTMKRTEEGNSNGGDDVIEDVNDASSSSSLELYCTIAQCPEQAVMRIVLFCSRDALAIDTLGEQQIRRLQSEGLLANGAVDIFELHRHRDKLEQLEGWGEKKVANLLAAIESVKRSATLDRLIFALGIPHIGRQTARLLAKRFGSVQRLMTASVDELNKIHSIGRVTAQAIVQWMSNDENRRFLERLKTEGFVAATASDSVSPLNDGSTNEVTNTQLLELFSNKLVAITGRFDKFSRNELVDIIERHGGRATSGVSARTNVLLMGNEAKPSSKRKEASERNIPIISERQFMSILEPKTSDSSSRR